MAALHALKELIGLSAQDIASLRAIQGQLLQHSDELIDSFYQRLMASEYALHWLNDASTVAHLKGLQRQYFAELMAGVYDQHYAQNRIRVGQAHERIGLPQDWYIATYGIYISLLESKIVTLLQDEPQRLQRTLTALHKVVTLDMALVLKSYTDSTKQSVELAAKAQFEAERIRQLAYFDELTQLPNRHLFAESVRQLLAFSHREQQLVALIYLDLVHLKEVNDTLGHIFGDQLLRDVSQRLNYGVRHVDSISRLLEEGDQEHCLARISGDEFALAALVNHPQDVELIISRIVDLLTQPFVLDGNDFLIRLRFGVALSPADGEDYDSLLRHANIALHQAKDRHCLVCFYDQSLGQSIQTKALMARRLSQAITSGQGLELRFQPQIDLTNGELSGAEVLLRWYDEQLGWISPNDFIPLAEERGMIEAITQWVIDQAGKQRQQWMRAGCLLPKRIQIKLAINVSARDLDDRHFVAQVVQQMQSNQVDPTGFELELTETGLMRDPEQAIRILHELKQQGFSLAIDDFGTGHSALNYLREIHADLLKIDMSFIRTLLRETSNQAIVKTIIATAHIFGMKTLAEGIEDHDTAMMLQQMGCDFGQGFLYAKPLTATEFADKWLIKYPNET